jgi:cytochrome c oxidase subunit 2
MAAGRGELPVRKPHSIVPMLIFGAIATAVGIWIVLAIHWFPVDASQQAKRTRILYDVLLIASVPIFVLVITVIGFSIYWYRMRPGEELVDGPPIHGNTRLEVIWTVAPAILIVALCTYSVTVLYANEANHKNALTVDVTARQWAFEFAYPQPDGKAVYSPFLYLPNGRPVVFRIRSLDVIHSFFVPNFAEKIDAVPGLTTTLRVTPTKRGTYAVECTELCGAGHAFMRSTAYVLSPTAFKTWMSKQPVQVRTANGLPTGSVLQTAVPGIPTTGPFTSSTASSTSTSPATTSTTPTSTSTTSASGTSPAAGKAVFASAGCSGCHTLAAAAATGVIGPDLTTRLASDCATPASQKIRGTTLEACIDKAVTDPYAYIPSGYSAGVMPSTFASSLGPTKIAAVVNFLVSVTK